MDSYDFLLLSTEMTELCAFILIIFFFLKRTISLLNPLFLQVHKQYFYMQILNLKMGYEPGSTSHDGRDDGKFILLT